MCYCGAVSTMLGWHTAPGRGDVIYHNNSSQYKMNDELYDRSAGSSLCKALVARELCIGVLTDIGEDGSEGMPK